MLNQPYVRITRHQNTTQEEHLEQIFRLCSISSHQKKSNVVVTTFDLICILTYYHTIEQKMCLCHI